VVDHYNLREKIILNEKVVECSYEESENEWKILSENN
jgi:hypothetical protein